MATFDIMPYIKNGNLKHQFYDKTVEHYMSLSVHSEGAYPEKLIDERRPGESPTIKDYRKKIFQSKTKSPFNKVLNSLYKIRKAQDYSISFEKTLPPKIDPKESPEQYLTVDFPRYQSVDNWFWSACFKQQLIDPGAVVMVWPVSFEVERNEYYKPYPVVFNAPSVRDYKFKEWYLLKSDEVHYYTAGNRKVEGSIYYYVDAENITRFEQTGSQTYVSTMYPHELGYVPVVHVPGVVSRDQKSVVYYESRLSPMLPEFNEALREYSDLQAEVVQHIHSTLWAIEGAECKKCKGTGLVPSKNESIECTKCGGQGKFPFNPYEYFSIPQSKPGASPQPTPPAGYLTKPIDIAQLQDKRIQDHIYFGLSAINYEFIAQTPLNQSGTAKEFDKSETNNFVYSIAEDAVRVIDEVAAMIIDWRYSFLVPDQEERAKLYPNIPVPEKFDVIPDSYLSDEIAKLKQSKVSPSIIAAAEIDYAAKKFYHDEEVRERVLAEFELDPLAGNSEDDILMWLNNMGISQRDYVIHCNIRSFIEQAMLADEDFMEKDKDVQIKAIQALADAFISANKASTQVMMQVENHEKALKADDDSDKAA